MTGLDPGSDKIVEIATLVTDDELVLLAEGPDLVISTPPEALESMDEVVRQMHTRSGLLDAIATSEVTLKQAADETLEFVRKLRTRGAQGPALWELDRHGPAFPGRLYA